MTLEEIESELEQIQSDIEIQHRSLWDRQSELKDELTRLLLPELVSLIQSIKWRLESVSPSMNGYRVKLRSNTDLYRPERLYDIVGRLTGIFYHTSVELSPEIELRVDDGETRLYISNYISNHNRLQLNVNWKLLDGQIDEKQRELDYLKAIQSVVRLSQ